MSSFYKSTDQLSSAVSSPLAAWMPPSVPHGRVQGASREREATAHSTLWVCCRALSAEHRQTRCKDALVQLTGWSDKGIAPSICWLPHSQTMPLELHGDRSLGGVRLASAKPTDSTMRATHAMRSCASLSNGHDHAWR
ncbi:hypothetical protein C9397_03635 [Xanthomonas vasicola pv. vasculorum]|uniref:Uncharacterized protein n=1 Tax=Xanthomonas vasicola pv. vasculorum TaxID=325776 RepID=A0AAE8F333_XANVA|nr:hypothetical protein C7V42_00755 [Xanthomonas vasicola pv. vasculorum]AZR25291.1 hypothetical protein NX80_000805 [Xanthomonas vasicola pv. arecae]AZR29307.1 hypothetical protein KWO_000705 [Xanthomonas vasicola pv. musacearum NCPPB 4379]AZR33259.1 hypothetical protein NX08_000700 [Xanthomonas vasicola]RRJ39899.1 hypothetical protein EIM46_11625 [Xanthomonas vasicola pv. musacearum]